MMNPTLPELEEIYNRLLQMVVLGQSKQAMSLMIQNGMKTEEAYLLLIGSYMWLTEKGHA